jgi:iron complex outermembrane receptor protein
MNLIRKTRTFILAALAGGACLLRGQVPAPGNLAPGNLAPGNLAPGNLANATLEDLMKIDVTSVSKKEQSLSKTGAAVFVINREDIRRSGAVNIPDLLRMAPGVEVAQINANEWAISIRGFNTVFSNKVLVMIDGRTVYNDEFSGVYWDQIDVPLEDIERIEVIRGPGGTVWGANAVNGVINIITSSAADTKGGLAVAGSGNAQGAAGLVQYGGNAGAGGAYRIFGKYFNDENSPLPGGQTAPDAWHTGHAGFRSDWGLTSTDTLSVQGDFLASQGGEQLMSFSGTPPVPSSLNTLLTDKSADLLGRWEHTLQDGSQTSLQISDSEVLRSQAGSKLADNTLDVEFEHHLALGSRHDVVWGLDYRFTDISIHPYAPWGVQVNPQARATSLFAAFAQDEIRLGNAVFLTVGTKVERNDYTGVAFEPGVQLVWSINAKHSLWGSAARSIREPNSIEHSVQLPIGVVPVPGAGNALLVLEGNPSLQAERLTDYEVGYRTQLNSRTSLDLTGFLSWYRHLVTEQTEAPYAGSTGFIIPVMYENLAHARDYGVEFFANWQVTSRWRVSPGFSALRMSIGRDPGGNDTVIAQTPGNSPRQQAEVRSQLNLRRNLEWDSSLKYVARLQNLNDPAYARLDTRIGWNFGESMELSVVGQNLATRRRFEFTDFSGLFTSSQVGRTAFVKLTWRF